MKTNHRSRKKIPWSQTRFAKPYKFKKAMAMIQCAALTVASVARLASINSAQNSHPLSKAMAAAETVLSNAKSIKVIMENSTRA